MKTTILETLKNQPAPNEEEYSILRRIFLDEYNQYEDSLSSSNEEECERSAKSFYIMILSYAFTYGKIVGKREERARRKNR